MIVKKVHGDAQGAVVYVPAANKVLRDKPAREKYCQYFLRWAKGRRKDGCHVLHVSILWFRVARGRDIPPFASRRTSWELFLPGLMSLLGSTSPMLLC